jgi:hypothetical protein
MIKEYAIGGTLPPEQAKQQMEAGRVLTTHDGTERAMFYRRRFVTWKTGGRLGNVLMTLAKFTGWYVMEREDFPRREIATKDNTNTRRLNKSMFW